MPLYSSFLDFQNHYDCIASNLPEDFISSLGKLQDHISDEQITSILTFTEPYSANKQIVDCLVEQVHNTERVLDFCEWVGKIEGSPRLRTAIENLRKGICM